jgi:tryptophan synthase beta chain
MKSVAYHQNETFEAAQIFARTEGLIIAPESAHNLKYAVDEALRCKRTGEKKVIAFNCSGHGLLDLSSYESFLAGKLEDFEPVEFKVPRYAG